MKKLRIAQVGPLWENIPPVTYGGTERIVSYLTEELVKQEHDVTLFACGTSTTRAKLVSVYPRPMFRDGVPWTNIMYPLLHITEVLDRQEEFDIIHMHINKSSDYLALPLFKAIAHKVVFTLHCTYPASHGLPDRHLVFQKYKDLNYISLSNAQRAGGENLNWLGTVSNGIDISLYRFNPAPEGYLLWFGKINPDKGTAEAIEAAKKSGRKIILGGSIDPLDKKDFDYYNTKIKPQIDGDTVTYIGEATDAQKSELFGNALALINPIKWNEPFGLTMAESMACGTPVIALNHGSASEVVENGKTGFIVETVDEMVEKIRVIGEIDRSACRKRVEERFTTQHMVQGYLNIYHQLYDNIGRSH